MAWGAPNRIAAASQALGAPKGIGGKPGKPPGMQPQKGNAAPRHNANPHPNASGHSQPAHAGPPPQGQNLSELNPAQIHQRAVGMARTQGQVELAPLRTQAHELSATEQAAQQRFKAFGESQNSNLAGIGAQAEASAKTAANNAADNALKAGQSVETSGQTQAGLTGGYLSPEARAEIQAEGQRAAGVSGAGKSLAEQSGQNETNLMTNLRAAAAAKVTEGSAGIANTYGKQLRENANKQAEIPGRIGANTGKLELELGTKAFNQKATEAGLGIKVNTLQQKGQEAAEKVKATVRGQNLSRMTGAERNALTGRGLQIKEGAQGFNEWAKREDLSIRKLSAADKARYDAAQVRIKEGAATGKTVNPKEGRKYMNQLATAATIAKAQGVHAGKSGKALQESKKTAEEAMVKAAKGGTVNRELVEAAFNLAYYGRLSTADQAVAISYGLTPNLRPDWFRKK